MSYLSESVVWACFVPLALISVIAALIALGHFRPFYRSLDLLLISLVCGLFLAVLMLFPIFMAVVINRVLWMEELCKAFTWCFIATKAIGVISLVAIAVDGVLMLRVPGRFRIYGVIRSKTIHFCIVGFWIVAIVIGLIPVLVWGGNSFVSTSNECLFLPYEISYTYSIILAVGEFAGVSVSIICIIDAYFYLRHVKASSDFDPGSGERTPTPLLKKEKKPKTQGKRHMALLRALDFTHSAKDSWAVTCAIVTVSYLLCHIPFMLLCVIGVVLPYMVDHRTAVVTMLWLLLLEAIVLPILMWLVSVRYRHAHYYQVMTYICGCQGKTKDDYCDLQIQHRVTQQQTDAYGFQKGRVNAAYVSSTDDLVKTVRSGDDTAPYFIQSPMSSPSKKELEEQEISLYLSVGKKRGYTNQAFVADVEATVDQPDGTSGEFIAPDDKGIVRTTVSSLASDSPTSSEIGRRERETLITRSEVRSPSRDLDKLMKSIESERIIDADEIDNPVQAQINFHEPKRREELTNIDDIVVHRNGNEVEDGVGEALVVAVYAENRVKKVKAQKSKEKVKTHANVEEEIASAAIAGHQEANDVGRLKRPKSQENILHLYGDDNIYVSDNDWSPNDNNASMSPVPGQMLKYERQDSRKKRNIPKNSNEGRSKEPIHSEPEKQRVQRHSRNDTDPFEIRQGNESHAYLNESAPESIAPIYANDPNQKSRLNYPSTDDLATIQQNTKTLPLILDDSWNEWSPKNDRGAVSIKPVQRTKFSKNDLKPDHRTEPILDVHDDYNQTDQYYPVMTKSTDRAKAHRPIYSGTPRLVSSNLNGDADDWGERPEEGNFTRTERKQDYRTEKTIPWTDVDEYNQSENYSPKKTKSSARATSQRPLTNGSFQLVNPNLNGNDSDWNERPIESMYARTEKSPDYRSRPMSPPVFDEYNRSEQHYPTQAKSNERNTAQKPLYSGIPLLVSSNVNGEPDRRKERPERTKFADTGQTNPASKRGNHKQTEQYYPMQATATTRATAQKPLKNDYPPLVSSNLNGEPDDWTDRSSATTSSDLHHQNDDRISLGDSEIESILAKTGPLHHRKTPNRQNISPAQIGNRTIDRSAAKPSNNERYNTHERYFAKPSARDPNFSSYDNPTFQMETDADMGTVVPRVNVEKRKPGYDYSWDRADKTLSIMEFLMTKDDNFAQSDVSDGRNRASLRAEEELSAIL